MKSFAISAKHIGAIFRKPHKMYMQRQALFTEIGSTDTHIQ